MRINSTIWRKVLQEEGIDPRETKEIGFMEEKVKGLN